MNKLESEAVLTVTDDESRLVTIDFLQNLQVPFTVRLTPPRASDELTARMHCAIRCIAKQLDWAGGKLSEEDWKRLIVGTVLGQRVVPSLDGSGFVVLDMRTSRMSGSTKFDLVEWMYAWGTERGVVFND